MRYGCTECLREHDTFVQAAHCHPGIGGVIEVRPGETVEQAEMRGLL